MVGQLAWLGCLVACLATECTRQLDVPTMRTGARLERVRSRAFRGGQVVRAGRLMAHLAIERPGRLHAPPARRSPIRKGAEVRGMVPRLATLFSVASCVTLSFENIEAECHFK